MGLSDTEIWGRDGYRIRRLSQGNRKYAERVQVQPDCQRERKVKYQKLNGDLAIKTSLHKKRVWGDLQVFHGCQSFPPDEFGQDLFIRLHVRLSTEDQTTLDSQKSM